MWDAYVARTGEGEASLVHALDVWTLLRDLPAARVSGREPFRWTSAVKRRSNFELPPEALALVAQVSALEEKAKNARQRVQRDLDGVREAAATERAAVEKERAELARDREALEALLESRVRGFEFVADAWADYERARANALGASLQYKKHPAREAAKEVRGKGKELAAVRRELKRAEWVLRLYEFHFPWLTDLRDLEEEAAYVAGEEAADEQDIEASGDDAAADPAQRWLSKEEYAALSPAERNERALDRYLRSRKSPWQLGRDYERYIGYLEEQAGWKVTYQGIFAGLEDLGRDLICERDGRTEVVQCKRWAKRKTIHEKHVFQLFGTVVACRIENPGKEVTGTFTTTTTLSERAHQFADQLGITVDESVPLDDYPRVKCNVARRSGERIYHLPFDQLYDATLIEPDRGEFWAMTCTEAEERGFRRAWRWRGQDAATKP
jgi:hypothetical protein